MKRREMRPGKTHHLDISRGFMTSEYEIADQSVFQIVARHFGRVDLHDRLQHGNNFFPP